VEPLPVYDERVASASRGVQIDVGSSDAANAGCDSCYRRFRGRGNHRARLSSQRI